MLELISMQNPFETSFYELLLWRSANRRSMTPKCTKGVYLYRLSFRFLAFYCNLFYETRTASH